jgi:hypothetical protein
MVSPAGCVDAAAQKYMVSPAGCMVLNKLHKRVSEIEVGRLQDGVDEGDPDFDFAFNDDASDVSDDDIPNGDVPWLEDAEGSEDEEDASMFAPESGSGAAMQVEHEASFLDDI